MEVIDLRCKCPIIQLLFNFSYDTRFSWVLVCLLYAPANSQVLRREFSSSVNSEAFIRRGYMTRRFNTLTVLLSPTNVKVLSTEILRNLHETEYQTTNMWSRGSGVLSKSCVHYNLMVIPNLANLGQNSIWKSCPYLQRNDTKINLWPYSYDNLSVWLMQSYVTLKPYPSQYFMYRNFAHPSI